MSTNTTINSRLVFALLLPPIALYMIMLLGSDRVAALTREDGYVETFGGLCFLASAVAFLLSFRTRHNVFYLLFGLLFLFGFLQEISYGQRLFGFATSPFFLEHNVQREFNIHNLEWLHGSEEAGASTGYADKLLNADRLFSVFWFSYCVLAPVLCRFSGRASRLANSVRLPIVPLIIGMIFLLNYVVAKGLEAGVPSSAAQVIEIKEANFAYLFAGFAVVEYMSVLAAKRTSSRSRRGPGTWDAGWPGPWPRRQP